MKRGRVLIAALALGALWELAARVLGRPILPPASVVLLTFLRELGGQLGLDALASLWRVLASITLAIMLAVPAGLVLGQSERLNRVFAPVIYLLFDSKGGLRADRAALPRRGRHVENCDHRVDPVFPDPGAGA
jgi:ABC-type nitrate/sulfonate/bicarbonate transport system permease component